MLTVVVSSVLVSSCDTFRGVRVAIRSTVQEEPDYDRLEADRAARADAAGATRTEDHPPPYWTDFRGPGRLGEYAETPIATDWTESGLALLWRQPVGAGYGSMTIAEGLVFSLEQRRDEEALVAYELATGGEVWIDTWPGRFDELMSGEGPRTTPVYADGQVYALGASGELRCVEAATGALVWRADVLASTSADNLFYGLSATPLVFGETLIVLCGAPGAAGAPDQRPATVLALERASGAVRWRALDVRAAYASPVLVTLGGREQLLVPSGPGLNGLDAATGDVLWHFPWVVAQDLTCTQPIVIDANRVLLTGGYGKGSTLVEVQLSKGGWVASEVWSAPTMKTRFNSPVLFEGHVYGLDEGILACIDAASGKRMWKGGRYGYGQMLLAHGHLLVVTEDGDLVLLPASPDGHRELQRFRALDGLSFNVPAAAHGRLLLRNKLELACYELWPE